MPEKAADFLPIYWEDGQDNVRKFFWFSLFYGLI